VNQREQPHIPEEDGGSEHVTQFEREQFEQDLTRALRRVDAPEGFADRVMARAREQQRPPARVFVMQRRQQAWLGGAIAAALLLGVFGAEQIEQRQQRERAMMAQQQFEAGIRITDDALDHARDQLERAGVEVGK
jgi:hypothetical protein